MPHLEVDEPVMSKIRVVLTPATMEGVTRVSQVPLILYLISCICRRRNVVRIKP